MREMREREKLVIARRKGIKMEEDSLLVQTSSRMKLLC